MPGSTGGENPLNRQGNPTFQTLALNTPGIVYRVYLREENRMVFFNRMLEEMTGYKADELKKGEFCSIEPIILTKDRAHILEVVKNALRENRPFEVEYCVTHKRGDIRYFLERGQPVYGTDGEPEFLDGVILDITDRKFSEMALCESEERFRQIAENIKEVFWISSSDWMEVLYVSPTYESVWGRSCSSLYEQPRSWLDAVVDEDRGRVLQDINRKSAGDLSDPKFSEYRILRPDSSIRWIFARAFPVRNERGEIYRIAGIAEDITERKWAEEELRKARDELEKRVKERTAELERSNRELQDFAFIASHDLQEPLRKIRTFADMITRKSGNILTEQSLDYLRRMKKAVLRMQTLLTSLLDYSRVTTKATAFKRIDLNKSVQESLSDLEILIRENSGHVEVGRLPTLEGEPFQMVQLFQNLIANALKFHRPGHTPRIKIHADPVGSGKGIATFQIFVEDNGIGFDEKDLGLVFAPFHRLHGRSEYEGVGMGLPICRKIVERHGGDITAKSERGKGSTFIVTLPAKQNR